MLLPWILTIVAISGAILNSCAKKEGFYLWCISNTGFCVYNWCIGEPAMCILFGIYLVISINGIRKWSSKEIK